MQIIFIIYLFLFLIIYLSPIIIVIDCNYVSSNFSNVSFYQ